MKINKGTMVRFAGVAGTLMSVGATILSAYSNKREQEEMIDKKVEEKMNSYMNRLTDSN